MALHIIIDGYNFIRQSRTLSLLDQENLQIGREALVDLLAAYKKIMGHMITVVFDGKHSDAVSEQRQQMKGIRIVFSRHGELADAVIKRMAKAERERAVVVSSDNEIINFSASHGAATIGSGEFEEKVSMASYMDIKGVVPEEGSGEGWQPTTKKKGPSRRLSKKDKKQKVKIKKL
ncbi:MAG: NYN domain-containing protein [Desulfobacterales bacterium]